MIATNEVEKVITELLDPKTTCKRCEFIVCPALGAIAAKLKPASASIESLEKRLSDAYDRISHLTIALTKLVDMTKDQENCATSLGYVHKIASSALSLRADT